MKNNKQSFFEFLKENEPALIFVMVPMSLFFSIVIICSEMGTTLKIVSLFIVVPGTVALLIDRYRMWRRQK